jgi:hypothetical protein
VRALAPRKAQAEVCGEVSAPEDGEFNDFIRKNQFKRF